MNATDKNGVRIGECEASHFDGKGVDVPVRLVHGDMWLCADCILEEQRAEERSRDAALKVVESRKTDTLLELKQDVFVAGTVPFVELQAAIFANDAIPAEKKWAALVEEADKRYQTLTEVIFAEEAALVAKKNARHALHVNIQQVVSRLKETEKAKYANYNVNYKPVAITKKEKTVKAVKLDKAGYNKSELFDAAKKYSVPAAQIRAVMVRKNITAENAAKSIAEAMGLI